MPAPPLPDPRHIEIRLLMVAEMLEKAVAEVRRAMDDIKNDPPVKAEGPGDTNERT